MNNHDRTDYCKRGSEGDPGQPTSYGWTERENDLWSLLNHCLWRCGGHQAQDLATLHASRQVLDHIPALSLKQGILRERCKHILIRMWLRGPAPCKLPSQRIGLRLFHVFDSHVLHLLNVWNGVSCFKLGRYIDIKVPNVQFQHQLIAVAGTEALRQQSFSDPLAQGPREAIQSPADR